MATIPKSSVYQSIFSNLIVSASNSTRSISFSPTVSLPTLPTFPPTPSKKIVTGSSGYVYSEDYHPCLKYDITNPVWKIVRLTKIEDIRQILKTSLPNFEQSEIFNSIEEMNKRPYPIYFSTYGMSIAKFDEQIALSTGAIINLKKDHVYDPWYRDMADFKVHSQKEHSQFSVASMDNKMWECHFTSTVEGREIGLCLFMLVPIKKQP